MSSPHKSVHLPACTAIHSSWRGHYPSKSVQEIHLISAIMQLYWVFTTSGAFYARSLWFHLLRNTKEWGVVFKALCLFLPTVFDHRLLHMPSTKSRHDNEVKSTFFCTYLWPQLSSQEFLYFTRDKWQITFLFSIIRRATLCRKWDRVQALLFC